MARLHPLDAYEAELCAERQPVRVLAANGPGVAVVDLELECAAAIGRRRGERRDELWAAVGGAGVVRPRHRPVRKESDADRDYDQDHDKARRHRDLSAASAADTRRLRLRVGVWVGVLLIRGDRHWCDRSAAHPTESRAGSEGGAAASAEALPHQVAAVLGREDLGAAARAAPQFGQNAMVGTMR